MIRILSFVIALIVFYVTYQVAMKGPRLIGSGAFGAGYYTGLALFASIGAYCLYRAADSRS
jgi:hypothetical protein